MAKAESLERLAKALRGVGHAIPTDFVAYTVFDKAAQYIEDHTIKPLGELLKDAEVESTPSPQLELPLEPPAGVKPNPKRTAKKPKAK